MIKVILYIIIFLLTVLSMEGLDLNKLFKQSRTYQARFMYLIIAMSISYLATNFVYDFFISFKMI